MKTAVTLLCYGLVALFGVVLSAGFSGADQQKGAGRKLALFSAAIIAVQVACRLVFGFEFTTWVYPLIVHFPLVVLLVVIFKQPWLTAVASVLLAYLCCQIPRWIAAIAYFFSDDQLYRNILYIVVVPVVYYFLRRYAADAAQKLMARSQRSNISLGFLPLLYYIFDYATTIYTDLLYSGNPFVVQIMPSVMSAGYIFFMLIYQSRVEEQEEAKQERNLLYLQLRRSEAEYTALCQVQEQARLYHHDLRHHAILLMEFAEKGDLPEIKGYLNHIQQDLDAVIPKRFCGHNVVDLLLSHFESRADGAGVKLSVHAELSTELPIKDTELCSLLSNGLDNAIYAASHVQSEGNSVVAVAISVRQRNLSLSIQNPYEGEVNIVNGLPVTGRKGHGLGTRSIVSIVNDYGGLVSFSAKDGIFSLRATLPMR